MRPPFRYGPEAGPQLGDHASQRGELDLEIYGSPGRAKAALHDALILMSPRAAPADTSGVARVISEAPSNTDRLHFSRIDISSCNFSKWTLEAPEGTVPHPLFAWLDQRDRA
jgi:hypothetical protein